MSTPLASVFTYGAQDDATTLFAGRSEVATTLAADINDTEDETLYVVDATNSDFRGIIVVDDELIRYGGRFGTDRIQNLTRGYGGTVAASHTTGATVTIYPDYFIPKPIQDAILVMQETINDLNSRLSAIEAP